jgi:hypothetical protein
LGKNPGTLRGSFGNTFRANVRQQCPRVFSQSLTLTRAARNPYHIDLFLFFTANKSTYHRPQPAARIAPVRIQAWNDLRETIAPAPLLPLPRTISTKK